MEDEGYEKEGGRVREVIIRNGDAGDCRGSGSGSGDGWAIWWMVTAVAMVVDRVKKID